MEFILFIIVGLSILTNAYICLKYMKLFEKFAILLKSKDSIEYEELLNSGKSVVNEVKEESDNLVDIGSLNPLEFSKLIKGIEKK